MALPPEHEFIYRTEISARCYTRASLRSMCVFCNSFRSGACSKKHYKQRDIRAGVKEALFFCFCNVKSGLYLR